MLIKVGHVSLLADGIDQRPFISFGAKRTEPTECLPIWPMAYSRSEPRQHLEPASRAFNRSC